MLTFPRALQPPLLTQTIPHHFASIVAQHGDRMAVISRSQKERLTYRGLDERSNALARGLRSQGVVKGDRVAVSLGNNWEFAVVTYAVWKLGAVLVGLFFLLVFSGVLLIWGKIEWRLIDGWME